MAFEPPEPLNIADFYLGDRLREGHGDRVALHVPEGQLTYAQVERLAAGWASTLRDLGVRQEERVMVALPDGSAAVGALFG
ncbi:MAG TPA: AMP-binding protein, partial [Nitriliruptorales bacterium]|nr:AMP-binding protein [Nitriliruptorales bacterium]